jgi:hypothetical protein
VGEFKRALDLVSWGYAPASTAATLVLLDLGADALLAAAVVGIAFAAAQLTSTPVVQFAGSYWACAAFLVVTAVAARPILTMMASGASKVARLGKVAEALKGISTAPHSTLLMLLALTVLVEALFVAAMYPLLASIDPEMTVPMAIVLVMTSSVAGLVPITYLGLGTREVAFLFVLTGVPHTYELAIGLALTFVPAAAIGFIVTAVLDGAFVVIGGRSENI